MSNSIEFAERFAPQRIRSARESTAFGICGSKASTAQTLPQQPIFLREVFDRLVLPVIDPTGKQSHKELQRLDEAKHRHQY